MLSGARDVTLLGHVRPDADALGSALALGRVLARRGAVVRVSVGEPERMPETLAWLDAGDLFVPASKLPEAESLLVALDSASERRLGPLACRVDDRRAEGGAVLVVDHHAGNTRFGTHHVVDETAEATALLVLRLIDAMGEPLDEHIATCLYAGLVTDTGGFRRARPEIHAVAARLLAAGADPEEVSRRIVDDHPFAWLPMLAAVLGEARLLPDAAGGLGVVHTAVPLAVAATVRAEEVEGVINVIRTTREADVAVVLKEASGGQWSVSLRSQGGVDVSAAARELGGGGHRRAAGCTVTGELTAARERVLVAVAAAVLPTPRP
ncbi:DHH family phosphoesterase [Amycolatopsis antarctica]|uniref:DHH family phosphoesterase n=1 Tax=Amycolatopsis antarctica TaxID=1854586 RepID=UPI001F0A6450|nr:DHH family phosphoesterase [Amycolatopsis antarctica]